MEGTPRGTVLIVDDEESIRNDLYQRLLTEGYSCAVVVDGTETLKTASVQDFDVVLLDMDLPGKSGMEILSRIVAEHSDTCVVMMTTATDIKTAIRAIRLGAYDYVIKPLDMDDVVMRVEKALERRRLVLENKEYHFQLEQKVELEVAQIQKYLCEAVESSSFEKTTLDKLDAICQPQQFDKMIFHVSGVDNAAILEALYLRMARTMALIAEAREPYAYGHSERVGLIASEIATQLNCPGDLIKQIKIAALLHDIGKVAVPDRILAKQARLTTDEYSEVKKHPNVAVEIIQHVDYFKEIIPLVECHHEWYDGRGYPNKLHGESIPLGARILAVADAYDAMTYPRHYRSGFSNQQASLVLKQGAGKQWDPVVVDAFLRKSRVTIQDAACQPVEIWRETWPPDMADE